jgi:hypothetical protein
MTQVNIDDQVREEEPFEDVPENDLLARAIEEGAGSSMVSRKEVFGILEGGESSAPE